MISFLKNKNPYFGKRTFTFYIPSPPARKTGYQEREFDTLVEHITSLGFELIEFKMQSHSGDNKSGVWILCILGAKTKEIYETKIEFDYSQLDQGQTDRLQSIPLDPNIIHDN